MKRQVWIMWLVTVVFVVLAVGETPAKAATGEPLRLMRRPDISQGRIVFAYQNDLWLVAESGGMARRLTVLEGVEDYAKFSPDGESLAFPVPTVGPTHRLIHLRDVGGRFAVSLPIPP